LGSYIFYIYEKHHLLDQQKKILDAEALKIKHQLMVLHKNLSNRLTISIDDSFDLALLDIENRAIFSTYQLDEINSSKEYTISSDYIEYVTIVDPYYLGTAYLVIRKPIDTKRIDELVFMIVLFMLFAGVFFVTIGYFLGRLFIAPMRESIEMMNRFIQDTTHELNTPISTILTNLELIETIHNCSAKKEMQRIEIASKTLSRIYDDLTYLRLNHNYNRDIKSIDLSILVSERLLYFASSIESKDIELKREIDDNISIEIDRDDAIRLIDNLISNAIKYNRVGGSLSVEISQNSLIIGDSGIGIAPNELDSILERFKRANSSEGGFGIGLHIVDEIVQSYGFRLEIDSQLNRGTEVIIRW
jgi:two-component system OmpR family sensor kinase